MVASKATSPHVLTAMEVDYGRVDEARRAHGPAWKAAEGRSLTYLPFIVRAVAEALVDHPRINASVGDGELTVHRDLNLAVAVDLDFEGLVAPVVRRAGGMSVPELARSIADVAERARAKQLSPDDLAGGTFTVTNAGQYGTLFQFPIINQPQVAILSTDGVARKPVVVVDDDGNETVGVGSVGVLALAWDHRAFDGAYAASFLRRLRDVLEQTAASGTATPSPCSGACSPTAPTTTCCCSNTIPSTRSGPTPAPSTCWPRPRRSAPNSNTPTVAATSPSTVPASWSATRCCTWLAARGASRGRSPTSARSRTSSSTCAATWGSATSAGSTATRASGSGPTAPTPARSPPSA
jgi:2-oxoglutarate dehydrogenase E2 component (dihydrolipoamide succinyltransferase)